RTGRPATGSRMRSSCCAAISPISSWSPAANRAPRSPRRPRRRAARSAGPEALRASAEERAERVEELRRALLDDPMSAVLDRDGARVRADRLDDALQHRPETVAADAEHGHGELRLRERLVRRRVGGEGAIIF